MKESVYIESNGVLYRQGNTLYFINKEGKKPIPIENISDIYCHGKVSVKSGASSLLMSSSVPVHFFNKFGFYEGSLYPRNFMNAGYVIVRQVQYFLDKDRRRKIAAAIVEGIKHNILKVLEYYVSVGKDVHEHMNRISSEVIDGDIPRIMSSEGRIWSEFYNSFNKILDRFKMETREIRPPTNEVNALLSFGNSLLYATTLSEIYHTYLHPSISFLHEPEEQRFSLALDIADIFKPVIVDRVIFTLVNNRILNEDDFVRDVGVLLNDRGRRLFVREYQSKLDSTILHPILKRKVSYRFLIRLECYKLIKHVIEDQEYESFKMW
jgi:CRISPR-associated protein Cas1